MKIYGLKINLDGVSRLVARLRLLTKLEEAERADYRLDPEYKKQADKIIGLLGKGKLKYEHKK